MLVILFISESKSILSAHSSVDFSKQALADVRNVSYITSFRQGFLSTSLNPKALLFYVSIFPQFLSNGNIHMKSEVALFAFFSCCSYMLMVFILCIHLSIY